MIWALVIPETGPQDAPTFPEAALLSPAPVVHDFPQAPMVGFMSQMSQPL